MVLKYRHIYTLKCIFNVSHPITALYFIKSKYFLPNTFLIVK